MIIMPYNVVFNIEMKVDKLCFKNFS